MITRVSMNIDVVRISRWLVWLSAIVLTLGYLREVYVLQFGTETFLKDLNQIALDTENCLGAYYSSILMVIAALLLTVMGQTAGTRRRQLQWYFLALIFVLMSIDESLSFHEVLINLLRPAFSLSSYLQFAWIILGALFVLTLGPFYIPLVFSLTPHIRNRIILSGTLYLTGVLGFDAIGDQLRLIVGIDHPYYIVAFLAEESLEVLGLTLFATTLLSDLPRHFGLMEADQRFSFSGLGGADAAPALPKFAISSS